MYVYGMVGLWTIAARVRPMTDLNEPILLEMSQNEKMGVVNINQNVDGLTNVLQIYG